MSSSPARYTEDQHASIRSLYAKYRNVRRVAEAIGCSQDTVRRVVSPKFAARRLAAQRAAYTKTYTPTRERHRVHRAAAVEPRDPAFDPHRDGYPLYASPYAEFLGDPPIGRRQMLAARAPL